MGTKIDSVGNIVTANVDYRPSVEAKQFIEDPRVLTGFFGPLGCGKTTAGVIKSFLYAQAWPGARIAIIRDTYPNLIDTTQKTFFEWLPEGVAGTYVKTTRTFYLTTRDPNKPAEIIFRAMDQKDDVSNVLSLDLAAAWMDEPQGGLSLDSGNQTRAPGIDHDVYLLLYARLGRQAGYHKMIWLTGNPPAPSHWIAKTFGYKGIGDPVNTSDYALYLGSQDTNRHHLTARYYEDLERLYGRDTPLARRFLYGEWIEFAQMNPFHASWIQYYGEAEEEKLPEKDMIVEIGFDPAISDKDRAAKSAIVVAAQYRGDGLNRGRIYIQYANAGHWSAFEQADQIILAARRYKARAVRIEDVAYQRALKEILEYKLRQENLSLYVDLVPAEGDKVRRANSWSSWVEQGTVLFRRDQAVLIDCLLSVPGDKTAWDLVDAAGICVRGFTPLHSAREPLPELQVSRPTRAGSYSNQRAGQTAYTTLSPKLDPSRRAKGYTSSLVGI